jgi:hypothetical protein
MIKFFRRIRQKLLTDNKFSKYLLYAVGEILLVVIGILIALQVNNWNEARKEVRKERELLSELHTDLDRDLGVLDYQLRLADSIIGALDQLIAMPEAPADIEKTINWAAGGVLANYRYTAMEGIKANGIDIIRNKALTAAINEYYSWWDFGNELYRIDFDPFHADVWMPFFRKHMKRVKTDEPFMEVFTPSDYEGLLGNPEYRELLLEKRSIMINFHYRFLRTRERAKALKEQIEKYIDLK